MKMLLKFSRNLDRKAFEVIPPLSKPIFSQSYALFCSKIICLLKLVLGAFGSNYVILI